MTVLQGPSPVSWDRAEGHAITENWLQSGALKAGMVVCANNDEMALGAIQRPQGRQARSTPSSSAASTPPPTPSPP